MFVELPGHIKEQIFELVDNEKRTKDFSPSLVSKEWHDSILKVSSGKLVKQYLKSDFHRDTSIFKSHSFGEKAVIIGLAAMGYMFYTTSNTSDPAKQYNEMFAMAMLSSLSALACGLGRGSLRPRQNCYNFFKDVANKFLNNPSADYSETDIYYLTQLKN